jgi:hypothetical protein
VSRLAFHLFLFSSLLPLFPQGSRLPADDGPLPGSPGPETPSYPRIFFCWPPGTGARMPACRGEGGRGLAVAALARELVCIMYGGFKRIDTGGYWEDLGDARIVLQPLPGPAQVLRAGATRARLMAVAAPLTPRPRGTIYEALPFFIERDREGPWAERE